ncbi:hypothetical protein LCGC14_0274900 [marine sediment metagenome]|uniref:Putative zinc-finger domain-containing protein n=1 Tax=marine sediment metagenome TaxID=412755 RepID=A0A0F9UEV1_9ZZZZ|nr:hypothetical protein [Phycisphaerae bacterium]HDZ43371.1 hypothetical protein [Phycisphaerae bacterium]
MKVMDEQDKQREQLSAYLDGELSAADAQQLEQAIQQDPSLQVELEALRRTRDLLRQLPIGQTPPHFARDVLRRAERHHHIGRAAPGASLRAFRWISAATAAVVLIACGLAMIILYPPPSGSPDGEIVLTTPGPRAGFEEDAFRDVAAVPAVITETIWTDNLNETLGQVQQVLLANRLEAIEPTNKALQSIKFASRQANVFNTQELGKQQIQLELDILVDQAGKLRTELAQVRSQQRVSQEALPARGSRLAEVAAGAEGRAEVDDTAADSTTAPGPELANRAEDVDAGKSTRGAVTIARREPTSRSTRAGEDAVDMKAADEDEVYQPAPRPRVQRMVVILNLRSSAADTPAALMRETDP